MVSASFVNVAPVFAEDKHHEDPTQIVTRVGIGYTDSITLSGSIGLDDARMVSARINQDNEWRIGGSWLFDAGIVNFNFNRTDYDHSSYRNGYSIGTFVPLSYFDMTPGGWMLFPMAGYSFNEGEIAIPQGEEIVMMRNKSHGAYLGMFGLRPLGDSRWSLMGFAGGAVGSNSYSSYWAGAGLSYKFTEQLSSRLHATLSEDDFGKNNQFGFSVTYQL
ncbi:hypothetical protein ACPV4B_19705 [Vibrio parahaemolyticus]|uniref:Outer membrane protein beta-barrel domain-containing protein n=1 Tax=Vibrio mediterranei TaxID=689 RepID=A0ABX5DMD5_9VIBR|nr:hypothetical protein [Vibrio mediterranei]PCD90581.1 hypothetical protein COR52_02650 [Vibrio mediterranei]PRQ69731.1 hypothetical protein COR51_02945 [Vibrio mediterranei]